MSDAVLDDEARYQRECDWEDARTAAIERLADDYFDDPAMLGQAVLWCDHDTRNHRRVLLHVGAIIKAAIDYASGKGSAIGSLVTLTNSGRALFEDEEFANALERMAEHAIAERERYPDFNEP